MTSLPPGYTLIPAFTIPFVAATGFIVATSNASSGNAARARHIIAAAGNKTDRTGTIY
jgi:hypothetical protein